MEQCLKPVEEWGGTAGGGEGRRSVRRRHRDEGDGGRLAQRVRQDPPVPQGRDDRNQDLDCRRIKRPNLLNTKIEDDTKGHNTLQLQEYHKVNWQEYTFQEVVDYVAVEAIIAAVDAQYVEDLEEDYVGYKNQNIKTMVEQLQT